MEDLSLKETGELEKAFNSASDSVKMGLLGVRLSGSVCLVCTGAGFHPQQCKGKRMCRRVEQGEC